MSANASKWLAYADENIAIARLAMDGGYYNACLQNVQQAVEKYLKAVVLGRRLPLQKTHSIAALNDQLSAEGLSGMLTEEDCVLLDSIYLPSKYPFGSALPDFEPDGEICRQCIRIAENVSSAVFD